MPPVRSFVLAAGAAFMLLLGACTGPAPAAAAAADDHALTVFAAASLKEAMDEAAAAYRAATGQPVRVSYAASSALARQIAQGAPADVFVPADAEWMDALQAQGLVDGRTRTALLGNTLVLVAPATTATAPVELRAGVDLRPLLGQHGRIAMGQADSVPAGRYAKAAFTSLGVWDTLAPHVAGVENVRAALLLVARGEAPLGVVYGSEARAEPRVRVLATFPASTHPEIVYPVARVTASRHPQAEAFIDWLQTPPARSIFVRHGFRLR